MIDPEVLWMWLSSAEGVGAKRANDLWDTLCKRGLQLEDFFHLNESDWASEFGLNARVVKGLAEQKDRMDEITGLVESLDQSGVQLLTIESPHYPQSLKASLGRNAPVLLYGQGNCALLERSAAAIVGARDASERGLRLARSMGEGFARCGLVVISGGARGIDAEAHMGSLSASGATIIVLGCGIRRYRPPNALRELATPESTLFLSELPPKQTWDAGGAMGRNRIVCGLASAIVIVESQESGGTVHAAKKAFELGRPVFVIQFDEYDERSAGNPQLLRLGARPLKAHFDPDDRTWRVDIDPVVDAVEKGADASSQPDQMDLLST